LTRTAQRTTETDRQIGRGVRVSRLAIRWAAGLFLGLASATVIEAQRISVHEESVFSPSTASVSIGAFGDYSFVGETDFNRVTLFSPGEQVVRHDIPTPNAGLSHLTFVKDNPLGFPYGQIWFTEMRGNKVGRIASDVQEIPLPTPGSAPVGIADAGAEGSGTGPFLMRVYVTEFAGNKIARIREDGAIQEYPIATPNSGPWGITPGGWFTEANAGKIGRLGSNGSIVEYAIPTPNSNPREIVEGNGAIWFTEFGVGKIGRITPSGEITEFPTSSSDSGPAGIAVGSSGEIWFTEEKTGKIGVITPDLVLKVFDLPTSGSRPSGIAISTPLLIGHFLPPVHEYLFIAESGTGQVASATSDFALVPGAGNSPDWSTTLTVTAVGNFTSPVEIAGVNTELVPLQLPAGGSVIFDRPPLFQGWGSWIVNVKSFLLPAIEARVVRKGRPEVSAPIPVVRFETLLAAKLDRLAFPGASRSAAGARSNLALAAVSRDSMAKVSVRVEALTTDGQLLGARDFDVSGSLLIGDVLSAFGTSDLDNAVVRVRRTAGNGAIWGYLATLKEDGSLSISPGALP